MAKAPALTAIAVEALKTTGKLYEVSDGHTAGLRLAIQPSGAKSWVVRYRPRGTRLNRKLTLGTFPTVGLKEARSRAAKAIGSIAEGGDPAAEKRVKREETQREKADTVEAVVALFVERYLKAKKRRSWEETKRILERNAIAAWRGRAMASITKKDVHTLLDSVMDRGATIAANRVFAAVRKLCGWAVERGIIATSPCAGIKPPSDERSRDRVLDDDELARLWKACDAIGWPFSPIVRLLILTGARREEVGAMRWSEIDIKSKVWTLPKERSKNGNEHIVPLSAAALEILEALPRADGYVFTTTNGNTAVSGFSRAKQRLDAAIAADGFALPPWRLHDLRRSFASGCAGLGVTLPVIERTLNHVSGSFGGVRGVYQKFDFMAERRVAMDAWARHVETIVSGRCSNIIELSAVRS